jgi:surfactin family lipopeptide synthetase C
MSVDTYELSPIQQGMLFHWLLDRHGGTDLEQVVADLHEVIDPTRFARAWQHVVDAFSTLRTAFVISGSGTPLQRISPQASLPFSSEDFRALTPAEREARVGTYLATDRREGFDLAQAPAMRVALFRLAESHFRMVWSFHHILIDGRSFDVILNELFDAYESNEPRVVIDRPYREYIAWTGRQDPAPAREFWREKLRGFTTPTPVPFEHAPLPDHSRPGVRMARLPAEVTQHLRELAAREGLSLNTLVMGAWALLLSRYSGETDVIFGATKTTRRGSITGADAMVGLFLATVPVRISVEPELPVLDWLKRVRAEWVALRGFEHLPLVDIKQVSELPPSASLLDTLLMFENYQFGEKLHAQGGRWSNRNFSVLAQPNFPLVLLVYGDEALAIKIDYDARRFETATIDRILGHLATVLEAWAADVSGPLWRTPILTAAERQTIVDEWNRTATDYPRGTCVHVLFEQRVDADPDAVAVVVPPAIGDDIPKEISYRQLDRLANGLAHRLRELGVAPKATVAIALDRSAEFIIAVLAVLKAGAAYVPLDPTLPAGRLTRMLDDVGAPVVLTRSDLGVGLPRTQAAVVDLDDLPAATAGEMDLRLPCDITTEALAYVMYTSGSTGQPKGVSVPHRAIVRLVRNTDYMSLGPDDTILACAPVSFDASTLELWGALLNGGRIVVYPRPIPEPKEVAELLASHGVTTLWLTAGLFHLMVETAPEGLAGLRQLLAGGDVLSASHCRKALRALCGGTLINGYGPTENTTFTTCHRMVDERDIGETVPIGRPIANSRIYVLDDHLQPVPVGVRGELWAGGDGVALGYWEDPQLTAARFVPDPFSIVPGALMYRTGDFVRYRPDGVVEFLGRIDNQVKIRGYRIEPGEVEALLMQHSGVKDAAVVAREDEPGEKRLVGYVVPRDGDVDVAEVRAYLKQSLPDYMLPSAFVPMRAIPLTANGKVDRRALPAPGTGAAGAGRSTVGPRTYAEQRLWEIWEDIFGIGKFGVEDNFFDLGGHSLLAVRMTSAVARAFGKQLPLNAVFEAPTIAELAKRLEGDEKRVGQQTLVSIQAAGSRPPVYWIPGGGELGLFSVRDVLTLLGADQPVYGLSSGFPKSVADIETVETRAASYVKLVREFQPHGPYCIVGFCTGGLVAWEMAQRLSVEGQQVALVVMINCWYPHFAAGLADRIRVGAQRLRHQIRTARSQGVGVIELTRNKIAARFHARGRQAQLRKAENEIEQVGFQIDVAEHEKVLLYATADVLNRYEPRPYGGRISLFVSDVEGFQGVSRDLDPRLAWIRYAAACEVRRFPGGHVALLAMPYVPAFAEALKNALADALGDCGENDKTTSS